MKYLGFTVAGELFAADVTKVMKIARRLAVTPVAAAPPGVVGLANLKGLIVTILDLAVLLSGQPGAEQTEAAHGDGCRETVVCAVIFKPFEQGGDLMGLVIDHPDDLVDVEDGVISPPPGQAEAGPDIIVQGVAEVGGKLYRLIDARSVAVRFQEGDV